MTDINKRITSMLDAQWRAFNASLKRDDETIMQQTSNKRRKIDAGISRLAKARRAARLNSKIKTSRTHRMQRRASLK